MLNNDWPLVPAMLGTRAYPLGYFFMIIAEASTVDEFASKSLTSHKRTDQAAATTN